MTRKELIEALTTLKEQARYYGDNTFVWSINIDSFNFVIDHTIKALEQELQTFRWCTDCKEYDQEKHCCHRWSNVIRNTVEEMKQEYIEREVLDKIRAELYATAELHDDGDYYLREGWIGEIFDKYKTESGE